MTKNEYGRMDKDDEKETKTGSDNHTLFTKTYPEQRIKYKKTNAVEIVPSFTVYRMFMNEFEGHANELHEIFNTLWNASPNDALELRINSCGGYVNEGRNFYNIIKHKFNGNTTTILDSRAYSMGALMFCAGDTRIVMEHSELMFHDYSGGVYGKGAELESNIMHTAKSIRAFFRNLTTDKGFLSNEEFEQMIIGKDFWMDTLEMCKRGIATHVAVNGKLVKAKKYYKRKKGKQ